MVRAPALDPVTGAGVTGVPLVGPRTMIPTPVSFAGMPNTRSWAFEDRKPTSATSKPAPPISAKLLFMESALVYSSDWFVIPFTLPNGASPSGQDLAWPRYTAESDALAVLDLQPTVARGVKAEACDFSDAFERQVR